MCIGHKRKRDQRHRGHKTHTNNALQCMHTHRALVRTKRKYIATTKKANTPNEHGVPDKREQHHQRHQSQVVESLPSFEMRCNRNALHGTRCTKNHVDQTKRVPGWRGAYITYMSVPPSIQCIQASLCNCIHDAMQKTISACAAPPPWQRYCPCSAGQKQLQQLHKSWHGHQQTDIIE